MVEQEYPDTSGASSLELERALQVRVLLTVLTGLVIPLGPVTSGAMYNRI